MNRALWRGTSNAFRESQVCWNLYLSVHGISFWILKSGQSQIPKDLVCIMTETFGLFYGMQSMGGYEVGPLRLSWSCPYFSFLLDWQFMLQEHENLCTPSLPHPSNITELLLPALCLAYVVLTSPCSPAPPQGPQGPLSAGYYSSCSPEVTLPRKSSRVLSSLTLRQSSEFTFNEYPLRVKHPGVYFMSIIWCNPQNSIK